MEVELVQQVHASCFQADPVVQRLAECQVPDHQPLGIFHVVVQDKIAVDIAESKPSPINPPQSQVNPGCSFIIVQLDMAAVSASVQQASIIGTGYYLGTVGGIPFVELSGVDLVQHIQITCVKKHIAR